MIAVEGGHRQDAILELAQVKEEKQEERCTMDEKSKEAEYWRLRQLRECTMSTSKRCMSFRDN